MKTGPQEIRIYYFYQQRKIYLVECFLDSGKIVDIALAESMIRVCSTILLH